jgi:hypothetical protein
LASVRQKAADNTPQWQAFKTALDDDLPNLLNIGDYQFGSVGNVGRYALGYQVLRETDPATAALYADKAIALAKYAMRNDGKGGWGANHFVARGDGVTTTFPLPFTDNILNSSFRAGLASVATIPVTKGVADGQDNASAFYSVYLKVSNTSDGPPDYAESVMTSRAGPSPGPPGPGGRVRTTWGRTWTGRPPAPSRPRGRRTT